MSKCKCHFIGCRKQASWAARKLFGDRTTLLVCDEHKPDANKRAAGARKLPMFYDVTPIAK